MSGPNEGRAGTAVLRFLVVAIIATVVVAYLAGLLIPSQHVGVLSNVGEDISPFPTVRP